MNEPTPRNPPHQGMDYGETEDVYETHAAVVREKVEPRVGREPLSLWVISIYGLAVFFGGAYLGRYSGNFSGDGLDYLGGAPRATKGGAAGGPAAETAGGRRTVVTGLPPQWPDHTARTRRRQPWFASGPPHAA